LNSDFIRVIIPARQCCEDKQQHRSYFRRWHFSGEYGHFCKRAVEIQKRGLLWQDATPVPRSDISFCCDEFLTNTKMAARRSHMQRSDTIQLRPTTNKNLEF
jgi:hypothetical protein